MPHDTAVDAGPPPVLRWVMLLWLLACVADPLPWRGLILNEVMSANDSAVRDPADAECAEFDDWVELLNHDEVATSLRDVVLRAGGGELALPPMLLGPGERLLIWADDQPDQGPLHAPFGVSREGERVELWRGDALLDAVELPAVRSDLSWARVEDGADDWVEAQPPTPDATNQRVLPDDACFVVTGGFDDHSYPCIGSEESFAALAGPRTDLQVVKFDIFQFQDPARRHVRFVDSNFYSLHDQFYLFTVFNGQPFEGLTRYPPFDGTFRTWGELDAFAHAVTLSAVVDPFQATLVNDRFYSPYFYSAINGPGRSLGVGTVVHRPASDSSEAFWGFELEYTDDIAYEDLVVYFEVLEDQGPEAFADIRWLVRSPEQEALAVRMEREGLPFADRVTRYGELAVPGEVEVYHPGLTAGRVRRIRAGEGGWDALLPTDILITDEIPDELPPCAAFVTSVPQTPLSHIALLAQSRGIPNLYVAGVTSDAEWDAWSRRTTYVALEAREDGTLRTGVLTPEDYLFWQGSRAETTPALEPADPAEWAVDLASAGDMIDLRPVVGGKAAGMRQLLLTPGLDTPDTPLGLTVRGYQAHMDALGDVAGLLATYPFDDPDAALERAVVLLGEEAFLVAHPDQAATFARVVDEAVGTWAADLARGGGLVGAVADTPMPPEVARALDAAVEAQFAWLDPDQGLRFRSSSTVEDVEGFNGAGLYLSETGWRNGSGRTVEEAIRAVWASYWGPQAYEEREAAGIDHLAGRMGVLVHPRFDDELELSNGVMVATLGPDGEVVVEVNAQQGSVSVANPPNTCPPVLPERALVRDGVVERVSASTEAPPGVEVLSDGQLLALAAQCEAVLAGWLEAENARLSPETARSVLSLDLEMREMAAGWPEGSGSGPRLVVKQSRSLEPSAAGLPDEVQALPAPRDLLARAAAVERWTCPGVEAHVVYTNPRLPPDLGHDVVPFAVDVVVDGVVTTHLDGIEVEGDRVGGVDAGCAKETLWASPDGFLLAYLE